MLFDLYSKKMMGVCLRYCNDYDEAKDILQDGFIKIFDNIKNCKNTLAIEGWMKRIFINTAIDYHRKNKNIKNNLNIDDIGYLTDEAESAINDISAETILKIIQEMPMGYKTVFNLFAIEGYSHKEIADKLMISENTSKSQYSKAKGYLQKILISENIVMK